MQDTDALTCLALDLSWSWNHSADEIWRPLTDPPALAFANTVAGSEGPSTAYATVYPATMILRVLAAQLFVLYLVR